MNYIDKFLSPRLNMVVSLVPKSDTVCDVGTDHAYVAIKLIKSDKAKKVIATDINEGPLFYANKNIRIFNEASHIITRLSDGFSCLEYGVAETAVIAGMGGETIAKILSEDKGISSFVLQPQSAFYELRLFLTENGFVIENEAICREGRKMYVALLVRRGQSPPMTRLELEIGPYLIKERPPLFKEYIEYRLYEINSILKKTEGFESAEEKRAGYLYLKEEYEKLI